MSTYINNGSCITMGNNANVNGKSMKIGNCNSVSIVNGKVFIDGKEYKDINLDNKEAININIEGNVNKLDVRGDNAKTIINGNVMNRGAYSEGSIEVNGNVEGGVDCGGSSTISGDVRGNIDCGGSCTVMGDHSGKIDAGGSVITR